MAMYRGELRGDAARGLETATEADAIDAIGAIGTKPWDLKRILRGPQQLSETRAETQEEPPKARRGEPLRNGAMRREALGLARIPKHPRAPRGEGGGRISLWF